MLDWQRHEDELANARIAEGVVRSGRRHRNRRLVVAAALVAAVGVGVPLAWPSRSASVVTGDGTTSVAPPARPSRGSDPITDQVQLYLLVLAGPRIGGGATTVVPDRLCVGAARRPVLPCRGTAIPARVRAGVERAAPAVRFVATAVWPQRTGQPGVVGFGALDVRGDHATLETQSLCGPLCGNGGRWQFVRHGARWTTAGFSGTWIS